MSSPLQGLEPRYLWSHFDDIRKVPRPSKHEEKIARHVEQWAAERSFKVLRDAAGSMAVKVPATPGHEAAPVVVLQGHLDMVCEKNSDVEHDFMTQGIEVTVDGGWVKALGTTLGADNGIGLAAAMAIADDPEAVHGPLEILCTVDEETGLTGAKRLDPAILDGRIMLNLDTEEEGAVYIGCAGGVDSSADLKVSRRRALMGTVPLRLSVRGLRGGHSGLNIIENRANAIKLATRVLLAFADAGITADLVSLQGGSMHNAIPREAFATVRVEKTAVDAARDIVQRCRADFEEEFGAVDPDLDVVLEDLEDSDELQQVLNVHSRDRLLQAIDAMPHGVLAMSREVAGLVETSSNMAVVKTGEDSASLIMSHRSSIMPALLAVQHQVRSLCSIVGAAVHSDDAYPGWKPNPDSPIVKKSVEVYERMFGSLPELKAIHAGLECGLLIEKVPTMDVVSIGPQIENAHSPEERVQVSSVQTFYSHLKGILEDLA